MLDKAIEEARKLPPEQQDALGARILDELTDEAKWTKAFAETQYQLDRLADEVLKEIEAGKTQPLDFDRLK